MDHIIELSNIEKTIFDAAARKRQPFSGGFELTPYCNLACKMCYVKELKPGLQVLSGEQWMEIGRQAAQAGVFGIVLTGGEPLLHPDFKMIYSGLKKLGMILSINTNGTLIDEDIADFLAADMPRCVNISLYGADRNCYNALCGVPNAFDKTIRGIELLQERNIQVKINVTPSVINFEQIPQIFQLCRKMGLPIQVTPYLFEPVRKSTQEKQQYRVSQQQMAAILMLVTRMETNQETWIRQKAVCFEALERFSADKTGKDEVDTIQCGAGINGFWVCWDGCMNLCAMMPSTHVDILGNGFMDAWEQIKAASDNIRVPKRCSGCSLSAFCNSCAATSLHDAGSCEKISPYICQTTQVYARMMANGIVKKEQSEIESERESQ